MIVDWLCDNYLRILENIIHVIANLINYIIESVITVYSYKYFFFFNILTNSRWISHHYRKSIIQVRKNRIKKTELMIWLLANKNRPHNLKCQRSFICRGSSEGCGWTMTPGSFCGRSSSLKSGHWGYHKMNSLWRSPIRLIYSSDPFTVRGCELITNNNFYINFLPDRFNFRQKLAHNEL